MEQKTQRWTAGRKAELVLHIFKNEITLVEACRSNDLKQSEVESWIEEFISACTKGLKTNNKDAQDEQVTAVIDCCDGNIVGWRFSSSGSAKIATAALEDALRSRKIKLGGNNGLVFGSKEFTKLSKGYNLNQEFITPYTPEQNGIIERFFRTLKEECIWGYNFKNKDEAFRKIAEWIDKYHAYRPHSALGYMTPDEFRQLKLSA